MESCLEEAGSSFSFFAPGEEISPWLFRIRALRMDKAYNHANYATELLGTTLQTLGYEEGLLMQGQRHRIVFDSLEESNIKLPGDLAVLINDFAGTSSSWELPKLAGNSPEQPQAESSELEELFISALYPKSFLPFLRSYGVAPPPPEGSWLALWRYYRQEIDFQPGAFMGSTSKLDQWWARKGYACSMSSSRMKSAWPGLISCLPS